MPQAQYHEYAARECESQCNLPHWRGGDAGDRERTNAPCARFKPRSFTLLESASRSRKRRSRISCIRNSVPSKTSDVKQVRSALPAYLALRTVLAVVSSVVFFRALSQHSGPCCQLDGTRSLLADIDAILANILARLASTARDSSLATSEAVGPESVSMAESVVGGLGSSSSSNGSEVVAHEYKSDTSESTGDVANLWARSVFLKITVPLGIVRSSHPL